MSEIGCLITLDGKCRYEGLVRSGIKPPCESCKQNMILEELRKINNSLSETVKEGGEE